MQCTQCNSDNVQRLSLVYEQGTQNIKTTARTTGHTFGGGGGLRHGFGRTTTTGKSQSIAAQKAAPPDKKKIIIPIIMIIVGLLLLMQGHGFILWGVIITAAGGFVFWKFFQYNKEVYPPLYANWERSWLCNKCGAVYMQ